MQTSQKLWMLSPFTICCEVKKNSRDKRSQLEVLSEFSKVTMSQKSKVIEGLKCKSGQSGDKDYPKIVLIKRKLSVVENSIRGFYARGGHYLPECFEL